MKMSAFCHIYGVFKSFAMMKGNEKLDDNLYRDKASKKGRYPTFPEGGLVNHKVHS